MNVLRRGLYARRSTRVFPPIDDPRQAARISGSISLTRDAVLTLHARESDDARGLQFHLVTLEKGSAIYHEGDAARHWYEVLSGIVRTCRFHSDGHRQLTGFFYPNEVFGVERPVYLESAESVTCAVLRRYSMNSFLDHSTSATDRRNTVLRKALDSARRSIFLFGHRSATNRVAAFVIEMAERSGAPQDVELPMTRGDIADHLNLTLYTVSRTISDFARKGLIALDGPQNVRILDLEGLRALSGDPAPDNDPMRLVLGRNDDNPADIVFE